MYEYKAKLIRVIDGDTLGAMIDLGFNTWTDRTIRFYGINSYESKTTNKEEFEEVALTKEQYEKILAEISRGAAGIILNGDYYDRFSIYRIKK
jgi:micrococcal nuclease